MHIRAICGSFRRRVSQQEISVRICEIRGRFLIGVLSGGAAVPAAPTKQSYPPTDFTEFTEFSGCVYSPTDFTDTHIFLGCVFASYSVHIRAICGSFRRRVFQQEISVRICEIRGRFLIGVLSGGCTSCSGKRQSRAETSAPPLKAAKIRF